MLSIFELLEPEELLWKPQSSSDHPSSSLCQAEPLLRHSTTTASLSEINEELGMTDFDKMSLLIEHVNVLLAQILMTDGVMFITIRSNLIIFKTFNSLYV
jgi:hypothetical protein